MLSSFPENIILTQYFAAFSSMLLFVETYRERVETTIINLSTANMNAEEIQEVGEELATLLGRVLEAKINVNRLKNRLDI